MHEHGSRRLNGPVRGSRSWWRGLKGSGPGPADGATNGEHTGQNSPDAQQSTPRDAIQNPADAHDRSEPYESALHDDGNLPTPRLKNQPVRWGLVNRVRQEIADGTYETQEKWEAALDRLLERLGDDV